MASQTVNPQEPERLDDLLAQANAAPNPLSQAGDQLPAEIDDTDYDGAPNQTPIDTLNDVLDTGEDIKDNIDQIKDLKNRFSPKSSAEGTPIGEGGVAEGAASAEGAAGAATTTGAEGAVGAEQAAGHVGKNIATGSAEKTLENQAVASSRSGWLKSARNKIADGRAKVAARQAARQAEKAAAKQVGKAAAKWGAKAAARWTAEAASGLATAGTGWLLLAADLLLSAAYAGIKKYGKYIFAVGALLIALPGILFLLYYLAVLGKIAPNSPAEQNQISLTTAFAGDVFETRKVSLRLIESEIARYEIIKENLQKYSTSAPADATAQADAIIGGLKEFKPLAGTSGDQARQLLTTLITQRRSFESQLPFNEWVARSAEELLKLPPGTCPIAPEATPNLGCASFVSYALFKAGVPQGLTAATVSIWKNPNLTLVVPNVRSYQAGYYEANKGSLKRGDVIWWGYGVCGRNKRQAPGGLHCHIGIYVGNGEAIHNSSSRAKAAGGIVPVKDAVTHRKDFNGAKRYGQTP